MRDVLWCFREIRSVTCDTGSDQEALFLCVKHFASEIFKSKRLILVNVFLCIRFQGICVSVLLWNIFFFVYCLIFNKETDQNNITKCFIHSRLIVITHTLFNRVLPRLWHFQVWHKKKRIRNRVDRLLCF